MTSAHRFGIFALGVAAAAVLAFVPALARSSDEPPANTPASPKAEAPKDKAHEEWRDELKKEMKDHPRLTRALIDLHETKEYLEKAPHDFGGHKVAAIKSVDSAIKELHEALKYDAKHEEKPAGKN